MHPLPIRHAFLAIVLVSGCVELPQAQPGVPDPVPDDMAAPCDDYILGAEPGGDDVCFAWVAISCDAETQPTACEEAVDIPSPSGDIACAWSASAMVVDAPTCAELEGPGRCVATRERVDGTQCRGTRVWSRSDDDSQEVLVVEVPCAVDPVPDFDACGQDASAACC
jgi:hypothetical protein